MAISTNGTVLARVAGALYNTQMSNATYSEVKTLDPATLADALYARDFSASTDAAVATTLVTNLGLAAVTGLDNWIAAQLTAAGSHKGAKIVDLLNSFAQMTADTTYGAYATAFNTKVDAALAASQTTGNAGGTFAAAGVAPAPVNGTFALTTSIDAIVGGAGDDAITAAATSASTGAANTTVNSGDSVDGGAGTDTLTITATAVNNNSLSGLTVKNVENVAIVGSDNLAVTAAGSATVADGTAQIIDWAVQAGSALTVATHTITAVINGVTHTTTYVGHASTGVADKQAAIVTLLNTVLGTTATAAGTSPEITLTSKAIGAALPTIVITETAASATTSTAAVAVDAASGQKNVSNALKTAASAVAEVITFTNTEGSTTGYASGDELTLYVDGVARGTIAVASTAVPADVAASQAAALSAIFGTGTAVALGATVVLTAPVAGVPLPHISFFESNAIDGGVTAAITRENVSIGATSAATISTAATVSASSFPGATSISVDGAATTVSSLTTQSVTLSGTSMSNTLKYSAGATAANVVLSAASGTVTFDDNSSTTATTTVLTANLSGTVKGSTASGHTQSTPGQITLSDALSSADTIKTLNLSLTSGATVVNSGLDKMVTFNAAGSTGAITATVNESTLTTVVGGSGNDVLDVTFSTDPSSATVASASINGGDGKDNITVSGTGTGTVTVDGGSGDDTVNIAGTLLLPNVTLSGGAGTDKLKYTAASTTLTAGELALIASQASGFERAEFVTTTSLDASKVSQFTILDAGATTAAITKLADAQTVNTAITTVLTSASYIGKGTAAAVAAGLTDTSYGGNLTVNATGASKTVDVNASSATVSIGNIVSTTSGSVGDQTASSVTIEGDVKTLTVNMTAGSDYVLVPTADVISSVTITPTIVYVSASSANPFCENGNLTSVTLTGVGSATIDNSTNANSLASSKLVAVDASQFGGVQSALAGANAGLPLGGLTYTGNVYLAETVTLGSGKDSITVNSTYDKMDTVNGFNLVANADGTTLNSNKSDVLVVDTAASTSVFVKTTTGLTGTTLGAVLTQVAAVSTASADDAAIFQFGGNTYVYVDDGNDLLDAADTVIKLTGLYDLDLLKLSLEANNI